MSIALAWVAPFSAELYALGSCIVGVVWAITRVFDEQLDLKSVDCKTEGRVDCKMQSKDCNYPQKIEPSEWCKGM